MVRDDRGWWWLLGGTAGLAAAALLGAWCWVGAQGDWRRAQQHAADLGTPTAESQLAPAYDPVAAADLRRAGAIVAGLDLPRPYPVQEWREGFALIGAHHLSALDELDAVIDRLPERPTSLLQDPWAYDRLDRDLISRTLTERIANCPAGEIAPRIRRAVRFEASSGAQRWYLVRSLFDAVARRVDDLRGDAEAAEELDRAIAQLTRALPVSLAITRAHHARLLQDATLPLAFFRDLGEELPGYLEYRPCAAVWVRLHREGYLDDLADAGAQLVSHPDPADWPALFPRLERTDAGGLAQMLTYPRSLPRTVALQALRGRTIAAEIRGEPWPRDWFDASQARMRPILRAGRVIGAYSVGTDGLDGGGVRGPDFCFTLGGEELGQTVAADPATKHPRPPRMPRYSRLDSDE